MESWIGQQLGPYELQSKLGAGGMGVVYRAVHQRLGQERAIKVLPAALAHDETFLQRFEREARLASELRHPNIVMIFDIAEDRGINYIVMELLAGRSLHEVIRKDGPLPLERTVALLRQLADALDFAHTRGVVHRDIKPGNAIVDDRDHLTLVDFGIARAAEGTRLTEASSRIGTAEYMAPESITEGDSGAGTDLYALGVIAYEMLTGRVPFTGVNSQTIMYAQIHTPPPPPRTFRADLPPTVEAVLLRQLDKEKARRYPTAAAFVGALEQAREGLAHGAAPPAADGGSPLPTAVLDTPPPASWRPAASGPATPPRGSVAPGARPPGPASAAGVQTPRPAAATGVGRGFVPPPPTSGVQPAPPSGLQRVIEESRLGPRTVYQLAFGAIVAVLLLMTFLPTPRDPALSRGEYILAFPFSVSGYVLGADASGHDVLSLMMVGGRFLALRLLVVGAILAGVCTAIRRRLRRHGRPDWLGQRGTILAVSFGLALALLAEIVIAVTVGNDVRQMAVSGWAASMILGVPRVPPDYSWGTILAYGMRDAVRAPWLVLAPGLGLVVVAAASVAVGVGIVDVLRVRAERRREAAPTQVAE